MKRTVGTILVLSLLFPPIAQAQETPLVRPGDRIRVTAPECHLQKHTGTLISLELEVLSTTVDEEDVQCPFEAVEKLELSLGKRHWWKGSLVGLGVGAGVGLLLGLVVSDVVTPGPGSDMAGLTAVGYGAFLGGTGLVIGTVVGGIRGTEGWRTVPLPPVQPYLNLAPHGGFGFGFSIPIKR